MGTVRDRSELAWLLALLESLASTRDGTVGRSGVSELTHCLQTADRARRAGADDELVLVALLHDAAKPLSLTSHGEVIAEILRSRVSDRACALLYGHGELQASLSRGRRLHHGITRDARLLVEWDAASFDPDYPTPDFEQFQPLLDRLYANEFARQGVQS